MIPPLSALTLLRYRPVLGRLTLPDVSCDLLWIDGRIEVVGPLTRAIPAIGIGHEMSVLRLDPEVARHWLGVPLSELTDRLISLEHISRTLASVVASLFEGGHVSSLVGDQFASVSPRPDSRVATARRLLSRGERVDSVASATCLSERQLERLFVNAIGMSPREYRRILRFRRGIVAAGGGTRLADVALEAGYADQAHFSRDVRDLTGHSPLSLLAHVGNVQDIAAGSL